MTTLVLPLHQLDPTPPVAPLRSVGATVPEVAVAADGGDPDGTDGLAAWTRATVGANDPCLVVDENGLVVAASPRAAQMLGETVGALVGRVLLDDVLDLRDFEDDARPGHSYASRIPPLLAIQADAPTRGLLRIRCPDGSRATLDAVAAPLHAGTGEDIVGSVTFLARV